MARRMTQMPELWALLKKQGFKGRDVPIIAGCGVNRASKCMAGRKTFTIQEAIRIATACGKNFEDIAGHFVPKSIERGRDEREIRSIQTAKNARTELHTNLASDIYHRCDKS